LKTYWSLTKSRKPWPCAACGRSLPAATLCWYAYDYGGGNQRRLCLGCRPLPDYVVAWLAAHPAEKPERQTFVREAEGWQANAVHARACGNEELAQLSEQRAAAMRQAAQMLLPTGQPANQPIFQPSNL
jgi:predicted Fe-S protein YdhL (DUF1289 family)